MAKANIDDKIKQIRVDIKENNTAPIYLLKGEEPYYIDLLAEYFEKNIIKDDNAKDFNLNILYGKDISAIQLMGICRQIPIMADKMVVILKEAQLMDKKQWSILLPYFQKPSPTTILVICFKKSYDSSGKGLDVKVKNQLVKGGAVIVESEKLKYDYQVSKWIKNYFKNKGLTCEEQGLNMLYEYLGSDLQKIANEIDKMLINISEQKQITVQNISSYIGISKDYNVFELQNALFNKDIIKSNRIINYFEQNPKENPIQMIFPILFSGFQKLLIASEVPSGMESEIASKLNTSPFIAKSYVQSLRFYSTEGLLDIISLFNEYDLKSKGIGAANFLTDADLLKELVYKILHTK